MATVSGLLTEIIEEGALDATSASLLPVLDRRHKAMARRSRSYMKSALVPGGTVATQQLYDFPAGLVEAREITVNGVTAGPARRSDISTNALGMLLISYPGKAFAETRDAAGNRKIALLPIPGESGLEIVVYGAYEPTTLLIDNTVPLRVDDEALEGLKNGVWASAMNAPKEGRQDLAAGHEALFSAACEELRQRVQRALRGAGPTQIRMSAPYG